MAKKTSKSGGAKPDLALINRGNDLAWKNRGSECKAVGDCKCPKGKGAKGRKNQG